MNVLFVASEAVPFIKTGGLADVMGALPKALAKKGMDVRLVIPKYSRIAEEAKKQMKEVTTGIVNLAWRQLYYGVEEIKQDGVTVYFIDNEWYFKRDGLYGYGDDDERFATSAARPDHAAQDRLQAGHHPLQRLAYGPHGGLPERRLLA